MTERPAPMPTQTREKRRVRRWPWLLVGSALVVGGVVVYAPTLFGNLLLRQYGDELGLEGGTVSGPLWSPSLSGGSVNLPGLSASAGQANVSVSSVSPATRTVHLNVSLADAQVKLNLKELLANRKSGGPAGNGWKVVLDRVDVQNTQLNLDGQGMNVPSAAVRLSRAQDGKILAHGRTAEGPLSAQIQIDTGKAGTNRFTVNFEADARLARQYWKGVQSGWVRGQYVIGDGPVRGDLKLYRGVVRVPEAAFVTVRDIRGSAIHQDNDITFDLQGRGWNGPVTAQGGIDLEAKHWTVTADASPTLAGLAQSLHTTGQGDLKLRVTAGGWTNVRVKGYVQGSGKLAGIAFSDANAEYTYLKQDGVKAAQTNDLSFSANTALAGQQKLAGRWAFGRTGQATWQGNFAGQPLDVQASINAINVLALRGQALGGPMTGTFALKGQQLNAVLNPTLPSASARVALRGTPQNLYADITAGKAGPFALAGTAHLTRDGLTADLGTVRLALDRSFKGRWVVQNLSGAGVSLSGQGQVNLPSGDLSGDVQASVPGVAAPLSGPLSLNYLEQRGTFRPSGQLLSWNGKTFGVQAADLALVGGVRVSGNLQTDTMLNTYGTVTARGNGYNLKATAQGQTAQVRGTAGGVTVVGDAQLRAPYLTTARIEGTDIRGVLSVQNGVRFTLTTLGQTTRGVLNGERWDATGRVNLAALRPLLPIKDLAGTLDLNLRGLGGTAQVNASASGANVRGTLTRTPGTAAGGRLLADLSATLPPVNGERPTAQLGGQVYPSVQARGPLRYLGQTLNVALDGPYTALTAQVTGRTAPLTFGSVSLPAQAVNVQATLTPALSARGTWGNLNLNYDGTTKLASVSGQQVLTALGRTGTVQGEATWGPNFQGRVNARGVLDEYTLVARGPWRQLNVLLTTPQGLRGSGTASVPDTRYDLNISGPLSLPGQGTLLVDGQVRGQGAKPTANLNVRDAAGGLARVTVRDLQNIEVTAQRLTLAGQTLDGTLTSRNGLLSGQLRAGPLSIAATDGRLRATGSLAGHQLVATGQLVLPSTVRDLKVQVNGPYLSAQAGGSLDNLRGQVTLKAQRFGSAELGVVLPAQTLPLRASLTAGQANVGGLVYQGGRWSGNAPLTYALLNAASTGQTSTRRGQVLLAGRGAVLEARPSGPLTGQMQLLPMLGGTLSTSLTPFVGLLPAELRPYLQAGQLVAQVRATGADLSLRQTRYLNETLTLDAHADWRSGIQVQGTLSHPGSRLPVLYDGKNLTVRGATLDAHALKPVLDGATGRINLNLSVPGLNFKDASGLANVNLGLQGQRAQGNVLLRGGQLSANLSSTLKGYAVDLQGPIYPHANASLSIRQGTGTALTATLRGNAADTLTLTALGRVQDRALNLAATAQTLTGTRSSVQTSGSFSGAAFNVNLNRAGEGGLEAWRTGGSVTVPDLKTFGNVSGQLSAVLGGTLANLQLRASGEASGVKFSAPASFAGGVLRVSGATATLTQGQVTASGTVFPTLNLQGRASVRDVLPGQYAAQVSGSFSKPDVRVQGQLATDVQGFAVAGTALSARLLGQDWQAQLGGNKLSGTLRGRLGSGAVGGLQNADLKLNTRYRSGDLNVSLNGTTAWNLKTGWGGGLRATGDVPGGPLDAFLSGQGTLHATGTLGVGQRQAGFNAQLPASLPLKPAGTVTVTQLDAGAFWNRAGQLSATGTATLGGATWNKLDASFSGRLSDSAGELSGDLRARYAAGDVQATLEGPHISGSATLRADRYDVTLKTDPLHLTRLLPAQADLNDLTFAGRVQARGSTRSGPEVIVLNDVSAQGRHAQVGPFTLRGDAQYQPQGELLKADLRGSLRSGTFTARGELPRGLNVQVNDIPTNYPEAASFGVGKLDGALTLTGQASDPFLSANLNVLTDQVAARLLVSGRARDPRANVKAELRGETTGTLYAEAQHFDFARSTVQAKVYGTVRSGQNLADVNLSGTWPDLSGTVKAQVDGLKENVQVTGTGGGGYTVDAGALGGGLLQLTKVEGWLPKLSGTLNLKPLTLVPPTLVKDAQGQANATVTLDGTLSAPTLAGSVTTVNAQVAGVTLLDTQGSFAGTLSGLTGTLLQGGKQVGKLEGQTLTLSDFGVKVADSTVKASGNAGLNGVADLALTSVGAVQGTLKATYAGGVASASGQVSTQGFHATLNVKTGANTGWSGTALVTGGPSGLLSQPADLSLSGPLAHPLVTGQAGVLGAGARIVASPQLVQVRLVDGPEATANGAVQLAKNEAGAWVWSGATSLTRPELSLSVTPSGPLADPQLVLSLRRGEWRMSGTASKKDADLSVTDGATAGQVTWQGEQVKVNLPGLDLARLDISGLNGLVSANGTVGTHDQNGQLAFTVKGFSTPQNIPVLDLQPAGDITGQLSLRAGQPSVQAQANLNAGTLNLSAAPLKVAGQSRWAGKLSGNLRKGEGNLLIGLSADAGGVHGKVSAENLPVAAAGQATVVNGSATFNGQTFTAAGQIGNKRGTLSAEGGLADALPALKNVLALTPTGDGYSARAVLNELDISRLKIAPNLKGTVSGEANLNDGGGTFFLKSDGLALGPKTLPARIEGTQSTGSWRLRGNLGDTEFTAGLDTRAQVFGQAHLRALPVGALISALTGETPGEGVVTGLASFRFPLTDPAAGSINVVAERIRVSTQPETATPVATPTISTTTSTPTTSATTPASTPANTPANNGETLTGWGTLDYANRELKNINVQLAGAGTWDVRGQYTRQKVDLNAVFTGTTFTPVLRLIPGLLPLEPSLKGSIALSAAGSYDRPRGLLRAENLQGSVAGLSVQVPLFSGELPDSGAFTGGGRLLTGGTVGTDGTLDLSGQLTLGKLSGTKLKFSGLLAPDALGPLPNTTAVIQQEGESWTVSAQSFSTNPVTGSGGLTLSGTLAPRWDLTLNAQNYNLPLSAIYAKESALTGNLRAVDDGNFIHVTGAANFARLTLGRVNTAATIPAPGENGSNQSKTTFNSPLPEQYTTFPTPQASQEQAEKRTLPLLNRLLLEDVKITAPGGIRVDENLARAEFGTSGLTVSGTGANPRITGAIEAQRGSIFLRENEFKISDGKVNFAGDGLYPSFHIVAEGVVPSSSTGQRVPITLTLDGDFRTVGGRPNILYLHTALACTNSADNNCINPATNAVYGEAELYALVATGIPNLASLPSNLTALGSSALQTALNVFVLGEVERTLARALGIDVFRLTPTLADDGTINATFTVGSYLTRNLFVQYQVDLTGKGLIDATYTTQDRKFTFKVSTPLTGLDLQSIRPSFSALYNFNNKASFSVGVVTNKESTTFKAGLTYRLDAR